MKAAHLLLILTTTALPSSAFAAPPEKKSGSVAVSKDVTAAQVNGTWEMGRNTFMIWALGGGRLRVAFDGVHEYKSPAGPMANTGEGSGIAVIEGDTAIFRPEGADEECKIVLKFRNGKLIVMQEGQCGFGAGVHADGTYRKMSSDKPKWPSP
jgi:hypothetical protein